MDQPLSNAMWLAAGATMLGLGNYRNAMTMSDHIIVLPNAQNAVVFTKK